MIKSTHIREKTPASASTNDNKKVVGYWSKLYFINLVKQKLKVPRGYNDFDEKRLSESSLHEIGANRGRFETAHCRFPMCLDIFKSIEKRNDFRFTKLRKQNKCILKFKNENAVRITV